MYQPIYEPSVQPSLTPAITTEATEALKRSGFEMETLTPNRVTYRSGDRFVSIEIANSELSMRIGIGSSAGGASNSMRLDEMTHFMFGGLKRGCYSANELELKQCLERAMKDLNEFAHDFLRGDFRPFLRILAMKNREEREAAKAVDAKRAQVYLA